MQARRDQEQHLIACDACLVQYRKDRAEDGRVGHRPGDVAHQDAGAFPAASDVAERGRADRLLERKGHSGLGIGYRRDVANGQRSDNAIGGKLHGQSGPAVVERDFE